MGLFKSKRKQCCGCFKTFHKPAIGIRPIDKKTKYEVCPHCLSLHWIIV